MERKRSKPIDYKELAATAEDLIRVGRFAEVRKLLVDVKLRRVPREHVLAIANLARRSGQPQKTLEILWPVVGPDRPASVQPTPDEQGEYAVALLALGSYQEAISILEKAIPLAPHLNLYLGFAHMTQWDYVRAIACFERFLELEGHPAYRTLLAQVNLGASLVALGDSSAWPLLREIVATAKSNGWKLFYKNGLELSAQLACQERNWKNAESFLEKIEEDAAPNKNDLFVMKWRALIELYSSDGSRKSLERLALARKKAVEIGHWETVRDCDYHKALVTKNKTLFLKVYFGSPFTSYRRRMEDKAKGWIEIPRRFVWSPDGQKPKRVFDLQNGRELGSEVALKPGKALHRVLRVLTADFYRPLLLGSIHARVFHDEHFNPESGSLRVHKAVSRLRDWLAANEIPIEIVSSAGGFRLRARGSYGFLISLTEENAPENRLDFQILIDRLKSNWPTGGFSSTHAAEWLEISERLARDLLRWGVTHGRLKRTGSGRATRYFFAAGSD